VQSAGLVLFIVVVPFAIDELLHTCIGYASGAAAGRYFLTFAWLRFPIHELFFAFVGLLFFLKPELVVKRVLPELHPMCRNCGYDLRGSSSGGKCPECGEAISAPASNATEGPD
jgi:hypothetical protein